MPLSAEPQLFVADLAASLRFSARLGFAEAFGWGDPAFSAQVARDGARERDALAAVISLDDPWPLVAEFAAAGLAFRQAPRDEARGARTFLLEDPDGDLILFAGRGRE
ncbi:MAG: hypothetical protein K2X11_01565 [Acetobacteraceae bacterium]|nr:hypothetical protein [Acetobacteraceae bacterium]